MAPDDNYRRRASVVQISSRIRAPPVVFIILLANFIPGRGLLEEWKVPAASIYLHSVPS